ncbi:MAG: protein-methionine-sulfoxide reductase catalytic subunit MsrP [Deltaproteobacteria bacterium]|nr:protein-methionine-sulfoxide reductase catalytic subunit MsrP [Deltaproteobacteria bacterium]
MLIKIRDKSHASEQDVTPKGLYLNRRRIMAGLAQGTVAAGAAGLTLPFWSDQAQAAKTFEGVTRNNAFAINEKLTPLKDVTSYNNFYEFGTDKEDPKRFSAGFRTKPWKLVLDGECEKPGTYELEDFLKPQKLEERIYRLRCVEAWSMVIPWIGFPLADVIKAAKPRSKAKFVAFTTLQNPEQMPGQKRPILDWPYREGLRLDEAMHPLTILAVGLYGEVLPNQNGAPLRLVVPWKYGFKSIKSIVRITFTTAQPVTSWNMMAPEEYGFYSNVNPKVDHPRWSQAKERRIGELFKRETLMFNGYDQVSGLYQGMDLKKDY